jgi:hypothetical protein
MRKINALCSFILGILCGIFQITTHQDYFAYSSNLFFAAFFICNAIESQK